VETAGKKQGVAVRSLQVLYGKKVEGTSNVPLTIRVGSRKWKVLKEPADQLLDDD